MSLMPYLINELYDDLYRPSRLLDQHFGCELSPEQLLEPLTISPRSLVQQVYRPWKSILSHLDSGAKISNDKDKFQVSLDVQQFTPNELTVKTQDNCIIVEGKHEEKRDEHGYISRQFTRRYALPEGHDVKDVVSSLSSDGVLTVTVPKRQIEDKSSERIVQIQHTGPAKAIKDKKSKL